MSWTTSGVVPCSDQWVFCKSIVYRKRVFIIPSWRKLNTSYCKLVIQLTLFWARDFSRIKSKRERRPLSYTDCSSSAGEPAILCSNNFLSRLPWEHLTTAFQRLADAHAHYWSEYLSSKTRCRTGIWEVWFCVIFLHSLLWFEGKMASKFVTWKLEDVMAKTTALYRNYNQIFWPLSPDRFHRNDASFGLSKANFDGKFSFSKFSIGGWSPHMARKKVRKISELWQSH